MNERDSIMRDVVTAAADNREDADRYKELANHNLQEYRNIRDHLETAYAEIEEWKALHAADKARYELAEQLLAKLSREVVEWWPNSDPPSHLAAAIRRVREVYPHMAKPR